VVASGGASRTRWWRAGSTLPFSSKPSAQEPISTYGLRQPIRQGCGVVFRFRLGWIRLVGLGHPALQKQPGSLHQTDAVEARGDVGGAADVEVAGGGFAGARHSNHRADSSKTGGIVAAGSRARLQHLTLPAHGAPVHQHVVADFGRRRDVEERGAVGRIGAGQDLRQIVHSIPIGIGGGVQHHAVAAQAP